MRSVRAFELLTLAVPFALFACGGDRDREAEAPSNTAAYEPTTESTPPSTAQEPMTPASRMGEERETMPAPESQGAAAQQMEQASTMSDEQFAAVTDAANTAEIDAA